MPSFETIPNLHSKDVIFEKMLRDGERLLLLMLLLLHPAAAEAEDGAVVAPESVAIGALLALRTKIGRAARSAMELAVREINDDVTVLKGTQLLLHISDTNCSAFQGAAAAVELMEKQVVAIAGPQTSEVAQFVAHMGTATQVPLVAFSATDPTLSETQYPYFIRMAHNDRIQMEAIADMIKLFEWKEVVALYSDDNFGTNGIEELHDAVVKVGATVAFKAPVSLEMSDDDIGMLLAKCSDMGGRIYIVHADASVGRILLTHAYNLRMFTTGFVWIVTEALSSVLDTIYYDEDFIKASQGVVGTRSYIPESPQLEKFRSNWKMFNSNRTRGFRNANVNVYGYYAYDAVWMIAYAIDKLIAANASFGFRSLSSTLGQPNETSDLARLPVFDEGYVLLQHILKTRFIGVSGKVELNNRGELTGSNLEIVNMFGRGLRVVGYWNRWKRLSVDAPTDSNLELVSMNQLQKKLHHIVWPGGGLHVPRGWMIPKTGNKLLIGVPLKQGYKEFVDSTADIANGSTFHGFCIEVFKAALSCLPYTVTYTFVPFGDGNTTPSYDELVAKVANKEFDAAVGDITITQKRAKIVDFTQPYTLSGLVLVVPVTENHSHQWAFLQPFSMTMWYMTGLFFFFTGTVIWLLERQKNVEFQGRRRKQIVTTFWFIFSTLYFAQRQNVKSTLGRIVAIIWLFVVLILISSYTASFTSILTVRRLKPTIQGISRLVESRVRIGYQEGSFVKDYLLQLNVESERLVPLKSLESYASALSAQESGVGAVVEELPYVQLLLSSDCKFTIAGEEDFSKIGWGFAFPKGSPLVEDVSTAILTLAESGELQRIHETWLHTLECSQKLVEVKANKLDLTTFSGLFGIFSFVAVIGSLLHYLWYAWHSYKAALLAAVPLQWPSHFSRGARFVRSFNAYVWHTGKSIMLTSERAT